MFKELCKLDLSEMVEKKKVGGTELSYVSWAKAWECFKKSCPDATYEIIKYPQQNGCLAPFMYDERTGYMVNTVVTANGITHEMWLPVLDETNKAMKAESYTYLVKKYNFNKATRKKEWTGEYEEKIVNAATMFDINTTIMRCLVKNLAMFGLGLYLYAGEDIPKGDTDDQLEPAKKPSKKSLTTSNTTPSLMDLIKACESEEALRKLYRDNKVAIVSNEELLAEITKKGNELGVSK